MILIIGANGTAGRAVMRHLAACNAPVRALVSNPDSARSVAELGATPMVGDMRDAASLREAMAGVATIYHIAPGLMPEELAVGRQVIALARQTGVEMIVLHGVSYPYAPHIEFHWNKTLLEAELLKSGLSYAVVRPTQYMQNIAWVLPHILETQEFALPYDPARRMCFVHIDDLGRAVARLLTEPGHAGATYELCSTVRPISRHDMAAALSAAFGVEIRAVRCAIEDLQGEAFFAALDPDRQRQLLNMYEHIDRYGTAYFNSDILEMLLEGPTTSFAKFAENLAAASR